MIWKLRFNCKHFTLALKQISFKSNPRLRSSESSKDLSHSSRMKVNGSWKSFSES
jgi:hypothetical protein